MDILFCRAAVARRTALAAMLAGLCPLSGLADPGPRVFFLAPRDGAVLSNPVEVRFGLEGMTIGSVGDLSPGRGHHHLLIDAPPVPAGQMIPADDRHLHFGGGQTAAVVRLSPGKHTLTLQFGNGVHQSYGPQMSQTITIDVDYAGP